MLPKEVAAVQAVVNGLGLDGVDKKEVLNFGGVYTVTITKGNERLVVYLPKPTFKYI